LNFLAFVLGLILVAVAAPAAQAKPTSVDQVMIWRLLQPAGTLPPNDMTIYFAKQFWLDDRWGVHAFYTPVGSAVLRGTARAKLGDLGVVGMAGARWVGFTGSLATFNLGFHEGPEGAVVLSYPVQGCDGCTLSAMGSYAYLLEENRASGEAKSLAFYALSLSSPPIGNSGTTLAVGVLGAVLVGTTSGLRFHDVGPTFTLAHAY
jgi:hypothetical protein